MKKLREQAEKHKDPGLEMVPKFPRDLVYVPNLDLFVERKPSIRTVGTPYIQAQLAAQERKAELLTLEQWWEAFDYFKENSIPMYEEDQRKDEFVDTVIDNHVVYNKIGDLGNTEKGVDLTGIKEGYFNKTKTTMGVPTFTSKYPILDDYVCHFTPPETSGGYIKIHTGEMVAGTRLIPGVTIDASKIYNIVNFRLAYKYRK